MIDASMLRTLMLLLIGALWLGCSVSGQVERGIERELPAAIGPADRYDVEIEGLRARAGEARRVTVRGERVQPENAPVLDRLDLDLRGVHYDRREERIERVERATATARITPADLAAFLNTQRNVSGASVALQEPNQATIRVRPELGGFTLPAGLTVEITGTLVAEAGRVRFDVSELRAAGANLGEAVARRLSAAINPVVDLSGMPARLQVTGVRVEEGAVRLDAEGDPTGLRLR